MADIAVSAILRSVLKLDAGDLESRFTKGEILRGSVIKSFGTDALVRLRGTNMRASTTKPLLAGEPLLVKVEQVKPQFIVSILLNDTPLQEKTAELLRLYMPSRSPIGMLLGKLETLIASLPQTVLKGSSLTEVMNEIKKAIMRYSGKSRNILKLLGLSHEAELAGKFPRKNLKRSLLLVQQNMKKNLMKESAGHREIFKNITKILQNIELQQLMNMDERQETKSFQLPYWNGESIATAYLYVKREENKEAKAENSETFRLTLMLEMSRLGPLRADIIALEKRLEGTIYLSTDRAVSEVEKYLPELSATLEEQGCLANFHAQKGRIGFITEEPAKMAGLPVKSLFNVKA